MRAPGWALLLAWLLLPAASAAPLLVGVVPDLPGSTGGEAVAIAAMEPMRLGGHALADGEDVVPLPDAQLQPGVPLWLVADLAAWQAHGGPEPAIPLQPMLRLGDGGDEVTLLAPGGDVLDAMAYGDRDTEGRLPAATPGLVFQRRLHGDGWLDTDSGDDWATPRVHRIGESAIPRRAFEADAVTLYASPDSSFEVLTRLVAGATSRLHLHVYELRSAELADALVAAKQGNPGLDLQVLVDADPVGADDRDRHATADALRRIQAAGGRAVLAGNGRYDDHHLKVLVADGTVAVQSENWVPSGVPRDPGWGNRGMGVAVHDAEAADWFAAWMQADRDAWDVRPFDLAAYDPTFEAPPRRAPRSGAYGPRVPERLVPGPVRVEPLVSPDHTQDPAMDPVAALVDGATHRVLAQQLDLATSASNRLGFAAPDPLLAALGRAASRGVDVRVQAAAPFASDDPGNGPEIAWLAAQGARAGVLERPGIATLHNKALAVDGQVLLVGSMNGNHHSRSANREAGLIVHSPQAAAWAERILESDLDPPAAGRAWEVPREDLRALPQAPWPTLFALLGVALALRSRR